MNGIYLLLGSNIGDRLDYLRTAEKLIQEADIKVLDESSIYETEPWGEKDQSWFLNIVLQVETTIPPKELLKKCLSIEQTMGRERKGKWKERTIDIDILYYNDLILNDPELVLPHPAIQDRRFTLIPLDELCPREIHPLLNETQQELLAKCQDQLDCRLTELRL